MILWPAVHEFPLAPNVPHPLNSHYEKTLSQILPVKDMDKYHSDPWHSYRMGRINDKQKFTLHLPFWPRESLINIDKRFTLHWVNQGHAMTYLHLAFGPGEPMARSAWVSTHVRPPLSFKGFVSNPNWCKVWININPKGSPPVLLGSA